MNAPRSMKQIASALGFSLAVLAALMVLAAGLTWALLALGVGEGIAAGVPLVVVLGVLCLVLLKWRALEAFRLLLALVVAAIVALVAGSELTQLWRARVVFFVVFCLVYSILKLHLEKRGPAR